MSKARRTVKSQFVKTPRAYWFQFEIGYQGRTLDANAAEAESLEAVADALEQIVKQLRHPLQPK